jgi:hypothetical protein
MKRTRYAVSKRERNETHLPFLLGNMKEKYDFEVMSVGGKIVLKLL